MRSYTPNLVGTIAIAIGIAALAGGVATRLNAEAVVGLTRMVDLSKVGQQAEPKSIEKLRAEYQRPSVIPFPKENPYTAEKVELGKKLYFDTRLFPGQEIKAENLAKAIATYERTVVSGRAPFDKWIEGDESAISESAKRGFMIFNTKAQCSGCHGSWRFTDDSFHDIGLLDDGPAGSRLREVPRS